MTTLTPLQVTQNALARALYAQQRGGEFDRSEVTAARDVVQLVITLNEEDVDAGTLDPDNKLVRLAPRLLEILDTWLETDDLQMAYEAFCSLAMLSKADLI